VECKKGKRVREQRQRLCLFNRLADSVTSLASLIAHAGLADERRARAGPRGGARAAADVPPAGGRRGSVYVPPGITNDRIDYRIDYRIDKACGGTGERVYRIRDEKSRVSELRWTKMDGTGLDEGDRPRR
jgi:hypothetical protein